MSLLKSNALFAAGGFVLGALGLKVLKSAPVKKLAVGAVSQGLKAKSEAEGIYQEAKAQIEDIVAEAEYLNESKEAPVEATVESKPAAPAKAASVKARSVRSKS